MGCVVNTVSLKLETVFTILQIFQSMMVPLSVILLFQLKMADISIKNAASTKQYSIQFYLLGADGSSCGDSISNVQIWYNQQNAWIDPSQQAAGNYYEWDCDGVAGCIYNLDVSVLISTVNGNPITLTNVIQNYDANYQFTTNCQLCQGTKTCYAPTSLPTLSPTSSTNSPSNSPTNSSTNSPTKSPTNSTAAPTIVNVTTSMVSPYLYCIT